MKITLSFQREMKIREITSKKALTANLSPTTNAKTRVRSKTNTNERKILHNILKLESFVSQWHEKLALENLKQKVKDEIKHQIIQQLDARCTTDPVKTLYEQIDILKSEVAFLQRGKSNLLKIIVTSKIPEAVVEKEAAKVFDNNGTEKMLY